MTPIGEFIAVGSPHLAADIDAAAAQRWRDRPVPSVLRKLIGLRRHARQLWHPDSPIPVVLVDSEEPLHVTGVPRSDTRGAHLIVVSLDPDAFRECVEDCPVVEELLRETGLWPCRPGPQQQVA